MTGTAEAGDQFGLTVAVAQILDLTAAEGIVVGVPRDRVSGVPAAGAVQVFWGQPGGPSADGDAEELVSQDTRGIRGGAETGDLFGASLAIVMVAGWNQGDLLIGAPGETLAGIQHAGAELQPSAFGYVGDPGTESSAINYFFSAGSEGAKGPREPNGAFGAALSNPGRL
ncbi:hypothetical protein ABZV93_24950 [Actinopolymorpha sp. NPDC004070]|uniref:hypothetical protein n=1 Tax=Actinopolymorpha sp. NPDC004070 TaxID=3154548 RepID=UPI0033A9412B